MNVEEGFFSDILPFSSTVEMDLSSSVAKSNWDWNKMDNLKDRVRAIFETRYLSDCLIAVVLPNSEGGEKCFKAHRIFLESASPVFQRLFREDKHSSVDGKPKILISDVSAKTFDIILRYLYLDEVDEYDLDQTIDILGSAIDYGIGGLIKMLTPRITGQINSANALKIYTHAYKWSKADVMEKAMQIICRNATVVVSSNEFLKLPEECLTEILKRDDLRISNELKLFEAVKSWGKEKCKERKMDPEEDDNLRQVLLNLIGFIRFPVMDQEDFTLNVAVGNKILSMEDMMAILLSFTVSKEKRHLIPPGRFKSSPRNYIGEGEEQEPPICLSLGTASQKNTSPRVSEEMLPPTKSKLKPAIAKKTSAQTQPSSSSKFSNPIEPVSFQETSNPYRAEYPSKTSHPAPSEMYKSFRDSNSTLFGGWNSPVPVFDNDPYSRTPYSTQAQWPFNSTNPPQLESLNTMQPAGTNPKDAWLYSGSYPRI